jgi:hypothetical protein
MEGRESDRVSYMPVAAHFLIEFRSTGTLTPFRHDWQDLDVEPI